MNSLFFILSFEENGVNYRIFKTFVGCALIDYLSVKNYYMRLKRGVSWKQKKKKTKTKNKKKNNISVN